MRGVIWFRADLRINDNLALYQASQDCRDGLVAIFYLPSKTWQAHQVSGCKVSLMLKQLESLKPGLEKLNIPLMVVKVDTFTDCVTHLLDFMNKHKVDAVYLNNQYEVDERKRDDKLENALRAQDKKYMAFDDTVLVPPGKILTPRLQPYTVFTPFKKAFMSWVSRHGRMHPVKMPEKQIETFVKSTAVPAALAGFKSHIDDSLWPAGEAVANSKLDHFVEHHLSTYAQDRDYPSLEGTSQLSAYLNIGAISPRMCLHKALSATHLTSKESVDAWVSELVWREFYQHVVYHFPHVCKGESFHAKYDALVWDQDEKLQKAWMEGQTGFPLVDAAMRQLRETGWMHNRLRMLVAMFFTKLMYQDWRVGEAYFMSQLVDGAFAANNGGWQWCASTGTDAAPYFRIFNPTRQSENFDPDGAFIKRYCPELASLNSDEIHDPWKYASAKVSKTGYPRPIIDYKSMRSKTLAAFKQLSKLQVVVSNH
jgi:deoxyribodipyrimidine photo-lyase